MYIFERIISIAIFLIVVIITTYNIAKTNDYRKIKRSLILFTIILSLLSYFYIPAPTSDMTRLRIYFRNTYIGMSFSDFLKILKITSTYTRHIYYYLISFTGCDQLLSVFSCVINYSIVCYILYDYSKNNNISGKAIANAFLLYIAIGEYIEVVSGFRSMCAFSIFFLCVYREFFKNKSFLSNLILYILAIGFHNAVVPLVFIRFLYVIFQKEKSLLKKILNYTLLFMLIYFTLKYGNNIIEATTNKAEDYLSNNVFYYVWTYITSILTIVLITYECIVYKKIIKEKIPRNHRVFFIIMFFIDFVFMFIEYTIFRRYSRVVVMLFLPFIMEIFNNIPKTNYRYIIIKNNLLYYLLLFIIFFIEISRGDLCGIRFFTI